MKELEEFKDDLVSDFVKSGLKTMRNDDFENSMMLKIEAEVDCKKEVSFYLKKSLSFFIIALFSGLIFMSILLFGEYIAKSIAVLILFVFSVFGFLCIDNYCTIIKKYSW